MIAFDSTRNWWLSVAYIGVFAIIVVSLVPGGLRPHTGLNAWLEHFIAYALVGIALGLGLRDIRSVFAWGLGLAVLAGVLEELQHFSPGRHPEIMGFIASSAGAWMGLAMATWARSAAVRSG